SATATPQFSLRDALPISSMPVVATLRATYSTVPATASMPLALTPTITLSMAPATPSPRIPTPPATTWLTARATLLPTATGTTWRSEEHTSELQSRENLVC